MQMENGSYAARMIKPDQGAASVYETESGALMLALKFQIAGDGPIITARQCLVSGRNAKNPSTVMENAIKSLKSWSGWDGSDPYWFIDTDLSEIDVELVVENESYQDQQGNTRTGPSVKWINKPGSGAGKALPDAADRKLILAKYGSKFRALSGGVPAKAPAPRAPTAAPAPTAPPARKRTAKEAMEAAWAALEKATPDTEQAIRETRWFALIDETGSPADALTPEVWDAIRAKIESTADLPF